MRLVEICIKSMVNDYYYGDRSLAAKAAGTDVPQLNNLISKGGKVARLDNGDWILVTKTSKIFKKIKYNPQ